jgi:radical SAM superfamily enzyme YgiQ (UPF0313 family)
VKVVGFTCTAFQTLASLALIRRIKTKHPQVKIACGGACFHDVMGRELLEKFEHIDAVCFGEGDEVMVPLFRALLAGLELGPEEASLYRTVDDPVRVEKLMEKADVVGGGRKRLESLLDQFVSEAVAITEGGKYLGQGHPQGHPQGYGLARHRRLSPWLRQRAHQPRS